MNVESVDSENENMYHVRVFTDMCLKFSLYPCNITSMCESHCKNCSKLLGHYVTRLFNMLTRVITYKFPLKAVNMAMIKRCEKCKCNLHLKNKNIIRKLRQS